MHIKNAVAGFAALSQETRVELLRRLAQAGPRGLAAGNLAEALDVAPSRLSFHLGALEQAGLVQSVRRGRNVIYRVRHAGLRALFGFLTVACSAGRPELSADLARLLPDTVEEEESMEAAFNVLFVCTRNSARSIMAGAILQSVGRGRFNAYSASAVPAAVPS